MSESPESPAPIAATQPVESPTAIAAVSPRTVSISGPSTPFVPMRDRVLVRPGERQLQQTGGIFLPPIVNDSQREGVVVAVGDGRENTALATPLAVSPGDRVLFISGSGCEVLVEGERLTLIRESDILGYWPARRNKQSTASS